MSAAAFVQDALSHAQIVRVEIQAPNRLQLTTHAGSVVTLEARTESVTGAPQWYAEVGTTSARLTGEAMHMLRNIQAVWFSDSNTELRPQAELLAAARADIHTLLRYALPQADGEDVAVTRAQWHAALWREAHDAMQQVVATDVADAPGMDVATARLRGAHDNLRAAGLLPQLAANRVLVADAADDLVVPPAEDDVAPAVQPGTVHWHPVASSNVARIAQNGTDVLVEFSDGTVYSYMGAADAWQELWHVHTGGQSVGGYVRTVLQAHYPAHQLQPGEYAG